MTCWKPEIFEEKLPHLKMRMQLVKAVRCYFDDRDFYEVETPALQVSPVMDTHIHAFKTELQGVDLKYDRTMYLHTSPEFAMKKLMVAGLSKLYQICHVFRNAEGSRLHSPEFTMIEWYRTESGYREIMDDCVGLLRHCAERLGIKEYKHRGQSADPFGDWEIITVCDAFEKYAGLDLALYLDDKDRFSKAVAGLGIHVADDDRWDDLFFRVFLEKIEPHLGQGQPSIIYDYPVSMASLSRAKPENPRFAERFEIYVCGMELANAFGELTDAAVQRKRFNEEMDVKEQLYNERYPIDEDFLAALEYGLPESGGIALGIDRLAMLASDAEDIEQVLWCGLP